MDHATMTQPNTLLLITDISGFTRFISESEPEQGIAHAKEMLEIIIRSNNLGLELCEIEGDAVFFYMRGEMPGAERLIRQVRKTFRIFQDYLFANGLDDKLGAKFFIHAGDCQMVSIGGRSKIFGIDVIKIHRLLKGVDQSMNYLLITRQAANALGVALERAYSGSVTYDHIGAIDYYLFNQDFLWVHPGPEPQKESLSDIFGKKVNCAISGIASQLPKRGWIQTVMSV